MGYRGCVHKYTHTYLHLLDLDLLRVQLDMLNNMG